MAAAAKDRAVIGEAITATAAAAHAKNCCNREIIQRSMAEVISGVKG
jgi:hypothetical protein